MINFEKHIGSIKDFPKSGIIYKDIQPLLEDSEIFSESIHELGSMIDVENVDYFVGIESRGFIFASALAAQNLNGFKMIRKYGKLPNENLQSIEYDLEYGSSKIQMIPGSGNVVLVDDVYATGGTMEAAEKLCKMSGYNVIDKLCLLDIGLKKNHDVKCLITL